MNLEWFGALYWFAGFLVGFGCARLSMQRKKNKIIDKIIEDFHSYLKIKLDPKDD